MRFLLATFLLPFSLSASDLYEGRKAMSRMNYAKALDFFIKHSMENPNNGNSLFYIGEILRVRNKKKYAVMAYEEAVHREVMNRKLRRNAYWHIILYYQYKGIRKKQCKYYRYFLYDLRKMREEGRLDRGYHPTLREIQSITARKKRACSKPKVMFGIERWKL